MKKILMTMILCSFAFGLGLGMNNFAMSDIAGAKIAYIDVNKLLASSKVIKAAENTRQKETIDILKWYDAAAAEINSQQSKDARQKLINKYEAELTAKKKVTNDNYARKIKEADNQIDGVITQKAKELGYNLVFRRESLLFGGDDITSYVLPLVK